MKTRALWWLGMVREGWADLFQQWADDRRAREAIYLARESELCGPGVDAIELVTPLDIFSAAIADLDEAIAHSLRRAA